MSTENPLYPGKSTATVLLGVNKLASETGAVLGVAESVIIYPFLVFIKISGGFYTPTFIVISIEDLNIKVKNYFSMLILCCTNIF